MSNDSTCIECMVFKSDHDNSVALSTGNVQGITFCEVPRVPKDLLY